jgi:hypothetical protein
MRVTIEQPIGMGVDNFSPPGSRGGWWSALHMHDETGSRVTVNVGADQAEWFAAQLRVVAGEIERHARLANPIDLQELIDSDEPEEECPHEYGLDGQRRCRLCGADGLG